MRPEERDDLYRRTYLDGHTRWLEAQPSTNDLLL